MCCKRKSGLSRLGLFLSFLALAMLLISFISGSWLYTKEPLPLEKVKVKTTITFRIGLWRVCPMIKRINATILVPAPACTRIKYSGWHDITHTDLGIAWTHVELAQMFITRMRSCTVLCSAAVILLVLAVFFGLLGHCNNDNKTIIAGGLFILGGLSLGCGLVIFVSALSATLSEIYEYHKDGAAGPDYDYRYGWCFFTAGISLILIYVGSALSFIGYLNRYSSVDEMVCKMVPGGERKLREHHLSAEYLICHSKPTPTPLLAQYDSISAEQHIPLEQFDIDECGPILNKTPPDVCTTNRCQEFIAGAPATTSSAGTIEINYCTGAMAECSVHSSQGLAGQTIPITIKNHNFPPISFSNSPISKYGTMPGGITGTSTNTILHQGFLGVSDMGSSSSNSSSGYCGKSKTLQHPKQHQCQQQQQQQQQQRAPAQQAARKCLKSETFLIPETSFEGFSKQQQQLHLQQQQQQQKANSNLNYSGSAV